MSEASEREWRFYLEDMLGFAEKVLSYTHGLDQKSFVSNPLVYDASLRNLELIGEAATHIPEKIRATYPEIPWRMLIATRNRLIHGYLGIDDDILWSIIQDDVPGLLRLLKDLKMHTQG
ncbi:HepT-like ribonuclease domain-containing protein [Geoalkalibacter halelectricus]|uniref:DUF86 domain-containing protein n=1 Tax=Geoalkalibacter halelectricus TaxID=2847045 RepID=A0ABY5ZML7_9BACT|nr:DUF86 domain-containing protein [Geoalkalibacter halelectricus]MDO3376550.1 DUF86 domain-containing protein [Geoalkalibacter halelectricus]UWZ78486.1 DUF86 domain-containing protein [Geoalkalibacter halelectricus]